VFERLGTRTDFSAKDAVGSKDERFWQRQPERPRSLEIDDEFKPRRLLYG